MPRELQCVASFGRLSNVFTITASTRASSILRGAPLRGSSCSPSTRRSTKRRRHLPTVARSRPSAAATSLFWPPSAQASTIRALRASACAVFRRIVSDFSSARSSSLNVKGASRWTAIGNSIAICLHLWHSDANLLRIYDCELVTRDTRSTSPRAAWQSSAGLRCRHTSARDGGSSACRFR